MRRCIVLLFAIAAPLSAQEPVREPLLREGSYADSVKRVRPISAFFRSLLIPGWGQAASGRWVTGASFVVWEGVCLTMTFKTQGEAEHIRASGAGHITTKKQEVQDWTILWIFNHFFAGAEAFVSAHLMDFPDDLQIRAVPRGLMVSMPLPRP
jgi:hypothetical protein